MTKIPITMMGTFPAIRGPVVVRQCLARLRLARLGTSILSLRRPPHKIVGGSYAGWATAYTEAIGKAGDAATVMAWIDANQQMLAKLEKGSPSDAANVKSFTEKHLAFLHRTAPKSDPISTGVPTKSKDAMPNIEKNYTGWIEWAVKKIAVTDAGDDMDALFESFDPFWDDLMPPDKDALLNTRRGREATQEP